MADKNISDLMMKMVDWDGQLIEGKSKTQLPKDKSDMLKGFGEGYILELTKFSFKAGLGGTEGDAESRQMKTDAEKAESAREAERQQQYRKDCDDVARENEDRKRQREANKNRYPEDKPMPTALKTKTPPKSLGFSKFRTNKSTETTRYPVDLKPVEFSRMVDRTSSIILDRCINRKVLRSITLVKRKPTGGPSSGQAFLRFDFHQVLLKSVEWTNETPIEEEVEFVCRGVTLNYKPQLPDGSLGAPISVFWKSPLDSTGTAIRQETLQGY